MHFCHHQVGQHQLELLSGIQQLERRVAGGGRSAAVSRRAQHRAHHFTNGRFIVHHQDALVGLLIPHGGLIVHGLPLRYPPKTAALEPRTFPCLTQAEDDCTRRGSIGRASLLLRHQGCEWSAIFAQVAGNTGHLVPTQASPRQIRHAYYCLAEMFAPCISIHLRGYVKICEKKRSPGIWEGRLHLTHRQDSVRCADRRPFVGETLIGIAG